MLSSIYVTPFLFDVPVPKPVGSAFLALPIAIGVTFFLFFVGLLVFWAYRERLALFVRLAILLILPTIGLVIGYFVWQNAEAQYQKSLRQYEQELKSREEFRRRRMEETSKPKTPETTNFNQSNSANR